MTLIRTGLVPFSLHRMRLTEPATVQDVIDWLRGKNVSDTCLKAFEGIVGLHIPDVFTCKFYFYR